MVWKAGAAGIGGEGWLSMLKPHGRPFPTVLGLAPWQPRATQDAATTRRRPSLRGMARRLLAHSTKRAYQPHEGRILGVCQESRQVQRSSSRGQQQCGGEEGSKLGHGCKGEGRQGKGLQNAGLPERRVMGGSRLWLGHTASSCHQPGKDQQPALRRAAGEGQEAYGLAPPNWGRRSARYPATRHGLPT